MDARAINKALKALKVGEPIEVVWRDACTSATRWLDTKEAVSVTLSVILTRGTFVGMDEGAVRVALDAGVHDDGSISDFHGIGVIDRGAIVEVVPLRRRGRARK